VSGFAIAIGGPDWWHTNPVGHFFNSLHLWSVELFMALLVIHLWGKFWMAAWRGRRAMDLDHRCGRLPGLGGGVLHRVTSPSRTSTSQWIATNGKDAFQRKSGIGAFFNLMNFGQMLMWHIVMLPIILIAIVGAHVLLVRMRGVSHPLPVTPAPRAVGRQARGPRKADRAAWRGPRPGATTS